MSWVMVGITVVKIGYDIYKSNKANKEKKKQQERADAAYANYQAARDDFAAYEYSNPYEDMTNHYVALLYSGSAF